MKKATLFFSILALSTATIQAQYSVIEASFIYGMPQGDFQQSLNRETYGFDASYLYNIDYTPIQIGVGLNFHNYGWQTRREFFSPNIQEVQVKVRTTNNMANPHFIARIAPELGPVSPFVEGTIGFNYLYTQSSVLEEWEGEEIATTINHDFVTGSAGIGGGIRFSLYDGYDDDGDRFRVNLVMKGRLLIGGEADYLREGDLLRTRRGLQYSLNRSRTDMTTYSIGFSINF
jgi:hypothetical protein